MASSFYCGTCPKVKAVCSVSRVVPDVIWSGKIRAAVLSVVLTANPNHRCYEIPSPLVHLGYNNLCQDLLAGVPDIDAVCHASRLSSFLCYSIL